MWDCGCPETVLAHCHDSACSSTAHGLSLDRTPSPSQIGARLMTEMGPWDTDWNAGAVPVHYNRWGPNKSINFETGFLLKNFADFIDAQTIVEVGTFRGYSTCWLLLSCLMRQKGHVTTFDVEPEGAYGPMFYTAYGFGRDQLSYVQGPVWDSKDLPEKIDLVFHDASHERAPTVREVETLSGRVRSGGVMLFDDVCLSLYTPMRTYLAGYFSSHSDLWRYQVLELGHGLGIAQKW